ncbi:MAG: gamma-glutamyltransferase [Bdellovibrionaceae bacterium]|nr:gamma-glutamyltransferase [Pseudobdellovibrionaceae bacterium]
MKSGFFSEWTEEGFRWLARVLAVCALHDLVHRLWSVPEYLAGSSILSAATAKSLAALPALTGLLPHFWINSDAGMRGLIILQIFFFLALLARPSSALLLGLCAWLQLSLITRQPVVVYGMDRMLLISLIACWISRFSRKNAGLFLTAYLMSLYGQVAWDKWHPLWFDGRALEILGRRSLDVLLPGEWLFTRAWVSRFLSPLVPVAEILLPLLALFGPRRWARGAAGVLTISHLASVFFLTLGSFGVVMAGIWGSLFLSLSRENAVPAAVSSRGTVKRIMALALLLVLMVRFEGVSMAPWNLLSFLNLRLSWSLFAMRSPEMHPTFLEIRAVDARERTLTLRSTADLVGRWLVDDRDLRWVRGLRWLFYQNPPAASLYALGKAREEYADFWCRSERGKIPDLARIEILRTRRTPEGNDQRLLWSAPCAPVWPSALFSPDSVMAEKTARGTKTAVATQGKESSRIALLMMEEGGNLADAAVAASFALAVERPQSTGLGGGGFLLFHEAKSGRTHALDFHELTPKSFDDRSWRDDRGRVPREKLWSGTGGAGTPGFVAGLLAFHERFGRLPREKVLAPAIELARRGLTVGPELHQAIVQRAPLLTNPAARRMLLDARGRPLARGSLLKQPDLARTLKEIASGGREVFYSGGIARKIEAEARRGGGFLKAEDLESYSPQWVPTMTSDFRGRRLVALGPPSSGQHVQWMLSLLEARKSFEQTAGGTGFVDDLIRANRAVQSEQMILFREKSWADSSRAPASGAEALARMEKLMADLGPRQPLPDPREEQSKDTTHLSLMDAEGNAVSLSHTLNGFFGSGVLVDGTGIFLNNSLEGDYQFRREGEQGFYRRVSGMKPGERIGSFMSPLLVYEGETAVLALGAPGGVRIPNCLAQVLIHHFVSGRSLSESLALVRIQFYNAAQRLVVERPGFDPRLERQLNVLGYRGHQGELDCPVLAAARRQDGTLEAAADPRSPAATARAR